MKFETEEEAAEFIKSHREVSNWVKESRNQHRQLNALIKGVDFLKELVEKIEKLESKDSIKARKKYSKDIRDVFHRIYQPLVNVFTASGGSVHNTMTSDLKDKFIQALAHFKGQKSITKYLSEIFFDLGRVDPNGLIFLEYKEDIDIFPTYKSINDIRFYKSDGQLLEVVLFEPMILVNGRLITISSQSNVNNIEVKKDEMFWRLVDDEMDWLFMQKGESFILQEEGTFNHPFGKPPAVILSDHQETGTEVRISPAFPIIELMIDYARDKSVKTVYKFQHGFPKHWRYQARCRVCFGAKKTGADNCKSCDGTGLVKIQDVTDIHTIEEPRDRDSPILTPDIMGFVTPDLETWEMYNKELLDNFEIAESTVWGTRRIKESGNETATGRFIDVQPVINELNKNTDNVEFVENQLSFFTEKWVFNNPEKETEYHRSYGRRFIIESPDVILERYNVAREKGANATILDKILDEFILASYQNNPILLEIMQKKRLVEPFIHMSITEVNDIFGNVEAQRKNLFVDFWNDVDKTKTVEQLKDEFSKIEITPPNVEITP